MASRFHVVPADEPLQPRFAGVVRKDLSVNPNLYVTPTERSVEMLHNRNRVPELVRRIQADDSKLVEVMVWNSSLGNEGITMLADALKNNTVVRSVSFSFTGCGAAGAAALAAGLDGNTSVQELKLSNNALGDEGAAAIAQIIATHPTIKSIELIGNGISETGGRYIADGIRANNPSLKSLDLSDNKLNEGAARAIGDAMAVNKNITSLSLLRATSVSINMARNTPFSPMAIDIINKNCLRNRGTPHGLMSHPAAVRGLRPDGWGPVHTRMPFCPVRRLADAKLDKPAGCPVHHALAHDRHAGDQDVDYGIYPTQVYDRRVAREHMSQPLALF